MKRIEECMKRIVFSGLFLFLLLGISTLCHAADPARSSTVISVDPFTCYQTNGIDQVQAINGLVVNGDGKMQNMADTVALHPSTLRLYLWVDAYGMHWKALRDARKSDEWKKTVMPKFRERDFDKLIAENFDTVLGIDSATGKPIPGKRIGGQFLQLKMLESWGTTKNIVLHLINPSPHPVDQADFSAYLRCYEACIRQIKKRFPDLGPLYVMIFNEPDYEYPRSWEKRSKSESITLFYELYNFLDQGISKQFPDVKLIGPGIASFTSWSAWKYWTVPFLQQVPDAQYFNCQPYARRFSDILAWTQMLQAKSMQTNGKMLPLIMTETNMGGLAKPADNWWEPQYHVRRVFNEARGLFGFLAHPDQFAMKHYFLYRSQFHHHDMWFRHDGIEEKAPVYWLYWLMRDVHGTRVWDSVNFEDAPFKSFSTRNGDDLYVCVFNESDAPSYASLNIMDAKSDYMLHGYYEYLYYDVQGKSFEHGAEQLPIPGELINWLPGEVKKFRLTNYFKHQTQPFKVVNEITRYASKTAIEIKQEPATIDIACDDHGKASLVRLQLALYLPDVLAVDRINWTVNGHPMQARFADSIAKADQGDVQPIIYVSTLIPTDWLKANNQLQFVPVTDTAYTLMFASLTQQTSVKPMPTVLASNAYLKQKAPAELELNIPGSVTPGKAQWSVKITNQTDQSIQGQLSLSLPAGWEIVSQLGTVTIPGYSVQVVPVTLQIPGGQIRGPRYLATNFEIQGQATITARRGVNYLVPFEVMPVRTMPTIDGNLNEWDKQSFFTVKHEGPGANPPYMTHLAGQWDPHYLYLALKVEGRALMPLPVGETKWWQYDTLEIFMDWLNHKSNERDPLTMQTRITFKDLATQNASAENFPSNPNGVTRAMPITIDDLKIQEQTDGYTLEVRIQWQTLFDNPWLTGSDQWTPRPGMLIGCAMALVNRPILGGLIKQHADPSTWGLLQLLAPEQMIAAQDQPIVLNTAKKLQNTAVEQAYLYQLSPTDQVNWDYPKTAAWDPAGLHLDNNHQTVAIAKPISGLSPDKENEFTFTISGFVRTQPSEKRFQTHARLFITPLEKGSEPYTLSDVLGMVIDYQENEDTTLSLFAKQSQTKGGFGKLLWRGSIGVDQYPLTVSVKINDSMYKVSSNQSVVTIGGSLSGKHDLPTQLWQKDLRCGIKSCYGSSAGQVVIKAFSVR
jgi:hypothetical protein